MSRITGFARVTGAMVAATALWAKGVALPAGSDGDHAPGGAACGTEMAITVARGWPLARGSSVYGGF